MSSLDPRAIERISGRAWVGLRPLFTRINEALLSVSEDAHGELTTIYIKYTTPDTGSQPYGVVWVKKASELVLGLALPDSITSTLFQIAPPGCKYAGLTKFVVIKPGDEIPDDIAHWIEQAYQNMKNIR